MKKIAFVVNRLIKSGPIDVVYNIVSNLDRTIFEPEILVLRDKCEKRNCTEDFNSLGIKINFFNFSFLEMEVKTSYCAEILDNYLKDAFEIVHCHSYQAVLLLSRSKLKIKRLITFHNICTQDFIRSKGFLLGSYMVFRYLKASKVFERKIGISKTVSEFYEKKLHKPVSTIYNGISSSFFSIITPEDSFNAKKRFGIKNEQVFVIIGSLSKRKNVLYIIDCIKKLNDANKLFYFVGEGPLSKKCKKRARNLKNVIFAGYQMNISDYIKIADFSIAASKSEGFGLAALEVVLSGIPLIYSDCKVFKELFFECEELKNNMFHLKNKNSLIEKIENCHSYKDKVSVVDFFKKKFDSEIMAKNYQDKYLN